jgi:hypothetical protein
VVAFFSMTPKLDRSEERRRLQLIGVWFNDDAPNGYPLPQRLVGRWDADSKRRVLKHIADGAVVVTYDDDSFCRFACGVADRDIGRRLLSDGVFAWPDGLGHYVEHHDVQLPEHFVAHTVSAAPRSVHAGDGGPTWSEPANAGERGLVDETAWLQWGRQQRACIALEEWLPLAWIDQGKVMKQLRVEITEQHPLFNREFDIVLGRRRTNDVVIRCPNRELAVVRLSREFATDPRQPLTQFLSGWDELAKISS